MHYRLGNISLAATALLLSLTSPLLPVGCFEVLSVQAQTTQESKAEAERFVREGSQQYKENQYQAAIESYQKALTIYRAIGEHAIEAALIIKLGETYYSLKQYPQAIESYQKALAISRTLRDRKAEVDLLIRIGSNYYRLQQYPQAIEFYQQALTLSRELKDVKEEVRALNRLAMVYGDLKQVPKAIDAYEQALVALRNLGNSPNGDSFASREEEMNTLKTLAELYRELKQPSKEIDAYEQMHTTACVADDRLTQGIAMLALFRLYRSTNQEPKVSDTYEQTPAVSRSIDDYKRQACELVRVGIIYGVQYQTDRAIQVYQQALTIYRNIGDRKAEASVLWRLGGAYQDLEQYPNAIASYEQELAVYQNLDARQEEIGTLGRLAKLYRDLEQYTKMLEVYQKSLAVSRAAGDRKAEVDTLFYLGDAYRKLTQPTKAIECYEQAEQVLAAFRDSGASPEETLRQRKQKADLLKQLGNAYQQLKQYSKAIQVYQQVLAIGREIGKESNNQPQDIAAIDLDNFFGSTLDSQVEALINLSVLYHLAGQSQAENEFYQQALVTSRNIYGRKGEFYVSYRLAGIYDYSLGRYPRAIELYQQALTLIRSIGDPENEIYTLLELGKKHLIVGPYQKAIDSYQQATEIYERTDGLRPGATTLTDLGAAYHYRGQYAEAIRLYEQVINTSNKPYEVAPARVNLGVTYHALGQYQKAIDSYQQALAIFQKHSYGRKFNIATTLDKLGMVYQSLGQHQTALKSYQQALSILQKDEDARNETAMVLDHLGVAYQSSGQTQQAIASHQQALAIFREIRNRGGEANALNNLGEAHRSLGQYDRAIVFYQQALAIRQNLGDREGEGRVLSHLGELLEKQNQPELAIVFYKQSVNVRESIRVNLRPLSEEFQKSYTQTVANTYRQLAKLLLQQDRVLEAQEVLDLLKLQELEDYLRNVRGNLKMAQALDFWQAEQRILKLYEQWIVQNSNPQFDVFVNSPEVTALVGQLRRTARGQNLNPEQLERLQDNLQALDKAALLYPLILEDRVELVLVTPSSLVRKTVTVDRVKLNEAIANFLSDITSPSSNPQPNAQQLYHWLIQPLEDDLAQAQVKTILYAADGQLRYIPLAALHDGKQWLIQRFTLNHITAASLTNFKRNGTRPLQILAAAYSDPQLKYQFQIGEDQFNFNGLTFAGVEVETIAKEIPGTTALFNKDFNRSNVEPRLGKQSIVHLATHAEFVSKSPHESFILFGSGERVTLADIDKWKLPNVDLVVLSACRTAASSSGQLGSGEEILGFGYQIQRTGAEAAIASLWSVDDGGTQALMNIFYTVLQTGKMTKAEALRQSQIALIAGDYKKALGEQRGLVVEQRIKDSLPPQVSDRLSHPFYWAPFILIGNGF